MFSNELTPSGGNFLHHGIIFPRKLQHFADFLLAGRRGFWRISQGDVVEPGLEGGVEEFLPLVADVDDKAAAEEQVFEAEAGRHAAVVE